MATERSNHGKIPSLIATPVRSLIEGVQRHRLDNGLTLLTREDHSVPIVTTMVWYRVGSRCESPGNTGTSHFLEHMLFKGSARFRKGEIDYLTARNGGNNNAFTSHDYTAYYFSFASDRWRQALEIEADRMRNNEFDPDELERERQVILEELKMDLDNPWGALRQAVEMASFERHPYRFPVIGLYEDLVRLSREQVIDFYSRFYSPSNATLAIVGDFETGATLKRVEELFAPLENGNIPDIITFPETRRTDQKRIELEMPTHVPRMLIALPAPSIAQPEHFAAEVLDNIFSEGKLSRLYRRLVEQERVASVVDSEFNETLDPHLFFIRAELIEGISPHEAEEIIFDELHKLRQDPVSDAELIRAKNQSIVQTLEDFETSMGQAVQIGLMEVLDRFEYWHTYRDLILSVTAADITQIAGQYTPQQAVVGVVLDGANHSISFQAATAE